VRPRCRGSSKNAARRRPRTARSDTQPLAERWALRAAADQALAVLGEAGARLRVLCNSDVNETSDGIDASLQGENSRDSQEEISKKEKRERPEPDSQPPQLESDFCRSSCVA